MPRSVYLQAPRGGTTHVSAPRPVQVEEMENENCYVYLTYAFTNFDLFIKFIIVWKLI